MRSKHERRGAKHQQYHLAPPEHRANIFPPSPCPPGGAPAHIDREACRTRQAQPLRLKLERVPERSVPPLKRHNGVDAVRPKAVKPSLRARSRPVIEHEDPHWAEGAGALWTANAMRRRPRTGGLGGWVDG